MKMVLTQKGDGKKLVVEMDLVKLMEPVEGGGTHVVFASDMGRVVSEELGTIEIAINAVSPSIPV